MGAVVRPIEAETPVAAARPIRRRRIEPGVLALQLLVLVAVLAFWQFGTEFGIDSIPTMWLVDRKGNLRDIEAREDLAGKVEKLLAEQ